MQRLKTFFRLMVCISAVACTGRDSRAASAADSQIAFRDVPQQVVRSERPTSEDVFQDTMAFRQLLSPAGDDMRRGAGGPMGGFGEPGGPDFPGGGMGGSGFAGDMVGRRGQRGRSGMEGPMDGFGGPGGPMGDPSGMGGPMGGPGGRGELTDGEIRTEVDLAAYQDPEEVIPESDKTYVENFAVQYVLDVNFRETKVRVTCHDAGGRRVRMPDSVSVEMQGARVTVRADRRSMKYRLSGASSNGCFKLYGTHAAVVELAGVRLEHPSGAALNIQSKKRHYLVLAPHSSNLLTDGATYATPSDEDEKAALFAEGDLVLSGSGSLSVTGRCKHAICSDGSLIIRPGVRIEVPGAVKDAVRTNNDITILGGRMVIAGAANGIKNDTGLLLIRGGAFDVTLDAAGAKAIRAGGDCDISGGCFRLTTTGDAVWEDNDWTSASCLKCNGNLTLSGMQMQLSSSGTAGKGISTEGDVVMHNGFLRITTMGNQCRSGRTQSSPKGLKAGGNVTIHDGILVVRTSGGEGAEGIESKQVLTVNGGLLEVIASDDGLNASQLVSLCGGRLFVYSSGNDAIDSNGDIAMSGGLVVADGGRMPEGGMDIDFGQFAMTGGTLLALGGSSSMPTERTSSQRAVALSCSAAKGDCIAIFDASGKVLATYVCRRTSGESMTVLYSSNLLQEGGSYTIWQAGEQTSAPEFYGFSEHAVYRGVSQGSTVVSQSLVSMADGVRRGPGGGGPGGPDGMGGPGGPMGGAMGGFGGPGGPGFPGGGMGGRRGPDDGWAVPQGGLRSAERFF